MIFQEPMTSLNPALTIERQITETIMLHQNLKKKEAREKAIEMLDLVSIPSPRERLKSYPHEFSGGMRQRVMIAIALVQPGPASLRTSPRTPLDVTIQAQFLDLLIDIMDKFRASMLYITMTFLSSGRSVRKWPSCMPRISSNTPTPSYLRSLCTLIPRD